ncbi:uncharacterized protein LY89DRAFT_676565 [Mollisia scopiformis]|uniref:Uncharacterized protein n=1 Tax=Mollisia scopiformis TaxID=149040 RepID=A0A132B8B3_MOLSC|nr:uncharacterized protein LY89DRAFT_676565 [Mollisia scopiformis]KUJ08650.1 hypothetical protein LY89DRAFT_676565 [Mollisia scopiformis]
MASTTPQPLNSPTSPIRSSDEPEILPSHRQDNFRPPQHASTFDGFERRVETGFRSLTRKGRKSTHTSLQDWAAKDEPYHRYVRELVAAGWSNLQDLDDYLGRPATQHNEVVSVLDITSATKHHYPDLKTNFELKNFLAVNKRPADTVRIYMAEYKKLPSAELIEAFGSSLHLDRRFFQWSIHSKGHVFTPSQRHRAPYVTLGCGVLDASTARATDVEKFKVLVYIHDGEQTETGWTALFLFSSRTKINMSVELLNDPPPFPSSLPPIRPEFKSFRQLYLDSFDYVNLDYAVKSPFILVSSLFGLNCFCWNQVITTIREEDARVGGISDTTIGHAEEITKTLSAIERGGSYKWHGKDEQPAQARKAELIEDYNHLVDQIKLLWETRDKMADIRKRNSDTRWTALTNAFTYL